MGEVRNPYKAFLISAHYSFFSNLGFHQDLWWFHENLVTTQVCVPVTEKSHI